MDPATVTSMEEEEPLAETRLVQPGEVALALGCVLTATSAILVVQVMIGLLAFLIAPVALGSLLIGALRARNADLPAPRQWLGVLLTVAGLSAVVWTSLLAADHGAQMALQAQRMREGFIPPQAPPNSNVMPSMAIWSGAILVGIGLWLQAAWSGLRCLFWSLVGLLMPPAILAFFHRFGQHLVLSA